VFLFEIDEFLKRFFFFLGLFVHYNSTSGHDEPILKIKPEPKVAMAH
jgi:hypothetical protein